jgi:hypothetical protein
MYLRWVPLVAVLGAVASLIFYIRDQANIGFGLAVLAVTFALLARSDLNR